MILSNSEIHKALDEKRLVIDPEPKPRQPTIGNDKCPYDTHSVDLRLSDEIRVPDRGKYAFDLTQEGELSTFISKNCKAYTLSKEMPFILKPSTFILGMTLERIELPIPKAGNSCLAARIEGKSSRARIGLLIHFTAPTVHPGFQGPLTLEMINLGPVDIVLSPGMPIAQLIVEEVKGLPFANPSQFQGQRTPEGGQ